jgi:hypothetical protein
MDNEEAKKMLIDENMVREEGKTFSPGFLGVIEKVNYLLSFSRDNNLLAAIEIIDKELKNYPELKSLKKILKDFLFCKDTLKCFLLNSCQDSAVFPR